MSLALLAGLLVGLAVGHALGWVIAWRVVARRMAHFRLLHHNLPHALAQIETRIQAANTPVCRRMLRTYSAQLLAEYWLLDRLLGVLLRVPRLAELPPQELEGAPPVPPPTFYPPTA